MSYSNSFRTSSLGTNYAVSPINTDELKFDLSFVFTQGMILLL